LRIVYDQSMAFFRFGHQIPLATGSATGLRRAELETS
jgi:hypothetical protein